MDTTFDLIVIGAGAAGMSLSRRAATLGAKVALIEQDEVGGTCILRGCVPKKLLMYAADYGCALERAPAFGWSTVEASFNMREWAEKKVQELRRIKEIYNKNLDTVGIKRFQGHGKLLSKTTVAIADKTLTAPRIVIATGAAPTQVGFPGIETLPTSDDLLELEELPSKAVIIGAGYIGVEFGSMLSKLGVEVTLLYPDGLPLKGFDLNLRTHLAAGLKASGVILRAETRTEAVEKTATGWRIKLRGGEVLDTPWAMNSIGRTPVTQDMGLEALGIELDEKHAIVVSERLETTVSQIFALGDVTNRKNLTPVAVAEGRWLAEQLFSEHKSAPIKIDVVATGVFTLPPIGSIGLREDECPPGTQIYETEFKPMRFAFIDTFERTYMKLLVEKKSQKILGIHIYGADAPEIIQSLAVAMTMGVTKDHFDKTMAVHPTSAEEIVLLREPTREIL